MPNSEKVQTRNDVWIRKLYPPQSPPLRPISLTKEEIQEDIAFFATQSAIKNMKMKDKPVQKKLGDVIKNFPC